MAGHDLNQDQEDYLEALSTLVEAYENEQHQEQHAKLSKGHRLLEYLCENNQIGGAELGRILGVSRAQGAYLLSGKRRLTVDHAVTLAKHFQVEPTLFWGE